MRILDRLVIREFVRLFILAILASPVLFILGDLTENLDSYMVRGMGPKQVLLGYAYQLPLFVAWGTPVAALIATIFTVNTMTRHSEVAAAKAGGISFHRLFLAIPILGVVLAGFGLGLGELVPVGNRLRSELMGGRQVAQLARSDFIYRDRDGRIFGIRRLDVNTGRITGITVEREGNEPEVSSVHVYAERAEYSDTAGWMLRDGYFRLMAGPDVERTFRFAALRPRGFDAPPDRLLDQQKDPDQMRYAELGQLIQTLERSGGKPNALKVDHAQKLAIPIAALVIVLFAAPLANAGPRGGAAFGVGVSLTVTIIYLMLFRVAGAAGASGAIPALVAAWLPNAIFALGSIYLITRVRT